MQTLIESALAFIAGFGAYHACACLRRRRARRRTRRAMEALGRYFDRSLNRHLEATVLRRAGADPGRP